MCTLLSSCDHSCPFNLTCKPHRPHLHLLPFSYLVCNLTNILLVSLSHGVRTTCLGKCDFCPRLSGINKRHVSVHWALFRVYTSSPLQFSSQIFSLLQGCGQRFQCKHKIFAESFDSFPLWISIYCSSSHPTPIPPSLRPILLSKLLFTADILPCEVLHWKSSCRSNVKKWWRVTTWTFSIFSKTGFLYAWRNFTNPLYSLRKGYM